MAKTKQTMRLGPVTCPVSAAVKRLDVTSTYLDIIEEVLNDFGDEITSISSHQRSTAYHNLARNYKSALMTMWEKASMADVKIILDSIADKELLKLQRMARLLQPQTERSKVIVEPRKVPELEHILGALTHKLPTQQLPNKEVCQVIGAVFTDLAATHSAQMKTAKLISDLVGLVTPEQYTLILVAAIPPTLHLVLPEGTSSPLAVPPTRPMMTDTAEGKKQITDYCKSCILPDPNEAALMKCDRKSPTRVLAAALYCTLERKYFDERTSRVDIAVLFKITTAQLTKAIMGIAYDSGPHSSTKKCKTMDADSTTIQQAADATSTMTTLTQKDQEPALSSEPPKKKHKFTKSLHHMKGYDKIIQQE